MPHAHMPGTWYTSDKGPSGPHYQGQVAVEETGRTVAITYDDEGGHNARLIAAAPEMLAACQAALQNIGGLIDGEDISRTQLKGRHLELTNAIARATGLERGK